MNRHTAAGDASVSLMCATFGLSRAAFYAEARRQRGDAPVRELIASFEPTCRRAFAGRPAPCLPPCMRSSRSRAPG